MTALISLAFDVFATTTGELLQLLLDFLSATIPESRKTEYTARFIKARRILSPYEKGFCLNGEDSLSIEDSFSNVLTVGGSGSGKSSRILIPSILKMAGASSLVIHDPSKELFEKTSGYLKHLGYDIKIIDYGNPKRSGGFNPLERIKSSSDIHKVSNTIVRNALGDAPKDPFWNRTSESLISLFAHYLTKYASPQYRNFSNVLYLINIFGSSPEKTDKLIVRTQDDALLADYKAFVAYEHRTLMGVIATSRAALSIFSDLSVAKVTSYDTLDFNEFRHSKTALYINNSVKDMKYYGVLSSVFCEQFFGDIMDRIPGKEELPIFFLIDEASSLNVASLPNTINNIRKGRAGILLIYQHYTQMVDIYGHAQARAIAANCYSKAYLSGQPLEVAQELESVLGKFQFHEGDILRLRSLMTADEIRQLKESIILCGNEPPILTAMKPYFEQKKLKALAKLQPYEICNNLPFDTPPLIPLEDNETDN